LKKWDDDIKVDLKEIELEDVDQINMAQVRDNMAGFLNVKIKLRVAYNKEQRSASAKGPFSGQFARRCMGS
jgi:hypothetical protein